MGHEVKLALTAFDATMLSDSKFWIYAIKSKSTDRIYVGQTIDLDKRLHKHNSGGVTSTKSDRPWELIACQMVENRAEAISKEYELKKSRGKRTKWITKYQNS